jgi:hypothetical protein
MSSTKHTGYLIYGQTGCTCCRSDNFIHGLFDNLDDARERQASHKRERTISSQYSNTGIYSILQYEYEKLWDGRIIIGDRIFDDESIYKWGEDANEISFAGKTINA